MSHGGKREGAGGPKKGPHLNPRAIEQIKSKIKTAWLLKRLERHISATEGVMVPSAVAAALGLLRKVLPDLASVEHSGEIATTPASQLTDDQLATIIASGSRDDTAQAPLDPSKLN